jgi:hypothetical protein
MAEQTTLSYPGVPAFQRGATRSGWGIVFALTLCVSTLIASEFMPLSILKGRIKVSGLTLPIADVAEGYRAMDERRAIKTMLRV